MPHLVYRRTGCYQGYEIRLFQSIEQTETPSVEKSAEGVLRAVCGVE